MGYTLKQKLGSGKWLKRKERMRRKEGPAAQVAATRRIQSQILYQSKQHGKISWRVIPKSSKPSTDALTIFNLEMTEQRALQFYALTSKKQKRKIK